MVSGFRYMVVLSEIAVKRKGPKAFTSKIRLRTSMFNRPNVETSESNSRLSSRGYWMLDERYFARTPYLWLVTVGFRRSKTSLSN